MADNTIKFNTPVIQRERKITEWHPDAKGRKRLGGIWSDPLVAEYLIERHTWQSVDDLARAVYGRATDGNRIKVRKNIPSLRRLMLHGLNQPFITEYGYKGRIARIKIYDSTAPDDKSRLSVELARAYDKKELTKERYDHLLGFFLLPSP